MERKTKKAQVVIAVNDQERHSFTFLLLQTNKRRGQFWQNVTGKVENEETFEEGALREAIEETGLNIESIIDFIDLELTHEFIDQHKRSVEEKSFLLILDRTWNVVLDPNEHSQYKWVDINEINHGVVKYPGNYEALEKSIKTILNWGR